MKSKFFLYFSVVAVSFFIGYSLVFILSPRPTLQEMSQKLEQENDHSELREKVLVDRQEMPS